jgi:hypothetical protein
MKISNVDLPSNKKFGTFFFLVFFGASIFFYATDVRIAMYSFISLSIILLIITLIKADILLPLNKLWMRFGLLLGIIISPVVLGFIFFALFMPIGILFKLVGRDELGLNFKKQLSYWIKREASMRSEPFKNQF